MNPLYSGPTILDVARAAGLKPKRLASGEYVVPCSRPEFHRNGDRHPSCRLNDEKGTFYCDPCGHGGGVKEFAAALCVDLSSLLGSTPTTKRKPIPSDRKLPLVFESKGPISALLQEWFASKLGKRYQPQTCSAFGVLEGRVHPDGVPDRAEDAVAFPLIAGGVHVYRYRRPDKKKRWCFANGGKPNLITAGLEREDPVLLCEGEWDTMRAYEAGFAVATGTGGAGTFRIEWAEQFAGKSVALVYDVDEAGKAGASKALPHVSARASSACQVSLPLSGDPDGDGKDLSDYLAVHSADELRALILKAQQAAGLAGSSSPEISVAQVIDYILSTEAPARIKRREAASAVIDDLQKRGQLIQAQGGRQFWFDRSKRRLLDIDAFAFRSMFISHYQVNPSEREYTHFMEAIKSATLSDGVRTTVVRFSYFDRTTCRLYVHAGNAKVLRLDGTAITWIENGADELLFEGDGDLQVVPQEAPDLPADGNPLDDLVLGRVNFIRGNAVILSPEQQRLVLRVWILSIFFPELLPARSLLLMYGEKGSGKTTTLRVILKLLVGAHANVTPLGKEDGFNATVSREFLIVLDNVDSFCRWIEDRLATVATGQTIKLRKLYTTNEMLSYPTRCCIALTARTPRFRRDDVVDRLLILRVARLEKFSREAEWYAEIEKNRSKLWAQLLRDLNAVVACLKRGATEAPESLRMADWGFVATSIADAIGQGDAVRDALEASEIDKAHFLLEADELYDLLDALASDQPRREWKAGELFAELKRRAEAADLEFTIKSPRSLGRILHRLEPALKLMIRFEIIPSPHDKQDHYVLGPLATDRPTPTPSEGGFHDPDF